MSPYTTSTPTTVHVIGKCVVAGCRNRKRVTLPATIKEDRLRRWTEWGIHLDGSPHPTQPVYAGRPGRVLISRVVQLALNQPEHTNEYGWRPAERFNLIRHMADLGFTCTEHDTVMQLAAVNGKKNLDKTCNARCTTATGPDCECACVGEQHGAAYA